MTFLQISQSGVENDKNGDDRSFGVFVERQLERDGGLEHPRNGRPELFERAAQGMDAGLRHGVRAELFQAATRFVARQACRRGGVHIGDPTSGRAPFIDGGIWRGRDPIWIPTAGAGSSLIARRHETIEISLVEFQARRMRFDRLAPSADSRRHGRLAGVLRRLDLR
jgi:hypothetical protein